MRRLRQGALAIVLAFAAAGALAPAAFGHAAFLESQPAPGTRLETSPRQLTLQFSEPLIPRLTRATLTNVGTGRRIGVSVAVTDAERLVVRPRGELARGAYRIDWHTVSPEDGHALEGSVGFGVRTDAASAQSLEQSPLERGGWLRVLFRALFYMGLIFFAGGVLNAVILAPGTGLARWLLPEAEPDTDAQPRLESRTLDAGWLAVSAGVATVVVDALDAGGTFTLRAFDEFLFSSAAGVARLVTVAAVLTAVLICGRRPRVAAAAITVAFGGVALAGHANSADARVAALFTDWVHLLAGSVWLGGIAQLAFAWWRPPSPRTHRSAVLREVLGRFGQIALPTFLVVLVTGLVNAAIQLGRVSALWETGYGQVLAVKITLVGAIAGASYLHALRLRPRLLGLTADASATQLERRHWRLLRSEPIVGALVIAVAALLVAFPLPPRQLSATEASQAAACDPCPQRAPAADELAVAEPAGTHVVAAWVRATRGGTLGEVRILDRKVRPSAAPVRLLGVEQRDCGTGCRRFRSPRQLEVLLVDVTESGRTHRAKLRMRWQPDRNERARRLVATAERAMRRLRTFRQVETVTSGPGTFARATYSLRAPDRMSFVTDRDIRTIIIGDRDWFRAPGSGWEEGPDRRPSPFRTRGWFRWTPFSESARLLAERTERGRRVADVAVLDRGSPAWYRLTIDLATRRVLRVRMISARHFMWQRFADFNMPVTIRPPA